MKLFRILLVLAILALCATAIPAADSVTDVPHLPPLHAVGFACDLGNGDERIVAVVVTYSDGSVVRFDSHNMHGFTTAQLEAYADSAPDHGFYEVPCHKVTST